MLSQLQLISLFISTIFGLGQSVENNLVHLDQCLSSASAGSKLVLKDQDNYTQLNYQYNNRNQVTPLGYFLPKSVEDVKSVIKCAKSSGVQLVARGGGHSYEKYSVGKGNQVVVDFRNLDDVKVDRETKTAVIGSGGLLGNVYYKLGMQGFALPAGSCPTVGIGGHTLGGGYGFSARKHGLMIDNLLEIGIVTADGEHKIASAKENSDLFWALRGGALVSFGFVTHFKFQLFQPPEQVTVVQYQFKPDQVRLGFESFQNWAGSNPDPSITGLVFANKDFFQFSAVIQADNSSVNQTVFRGLNEHFPQTNVTRIVKTMPFLGMIAYFGNLPIKSYHDLGTVKRTDQRPLYFHAKSGYVDSVLNAAETDKFMQLIKDAPSSYYMLMDAQGGLINHKSRTETAFVHRQGSLYSFQIVNEADNAVNGDKFEYYADKWYNGLKDMISDEAYQNYVDARDDGLEKYYGENLNRLLNVKKMVDPDNFFKLETATKA